MSRSHRQPTPRPTFSPLFRTRGSKQGGHWRAIDPFSWPSSGWTTSRKSFGTRRLYLRSEGFVFPNDFLGGTDKKNARCSWNINDLRCWLTSPARRTRTGRFGCSTGRATTATGWQLLELRIDIFRPVAIGWNWTEETILPRETRHDRRLILRKHHGPCVETVARVNDYVVVLDCTTAESMRAVIRDSKFWITKALREASRKQRFLARNVGEDLLMVITEMPDFLDMVPPKKVLQELLAGRITAVDRSWYNMANPRAIPDEVWTKKKSFVSELSKKTPRSWR